MRMRILIVLLLLSVNVYSQQNKGNKNQKPNEIKKELIDTKGKLKDVEKEVNILRTKLDEWSAPQKSYNKLSYNKFGSKPKLLSVRYLFNRH